jgi:hypothetical protein
MLKAWFLGVLVFTAAVSCSSPVYATSLTYEYLSTAEDGGPGAGILYQLVIDDASGSATFTLSGQTAASSVWNAGWFTFKFVDGSTPSSLTNLVAPANTGPWSVADVDTNTNVKVLTGGGNYGKLLNASSTGFYVTSLAQGLPTDNPRQGICLTELYCDPDLPLSFSFMVGLPTVWDRDVIPMQVGFYDGLNGAGMFVVNQLSRTLEEPDEPEKLPESGSTLTFLGLAILALGCVRMRW